MSTLNRLRTRLARWIEPQVLPDVTMTQPAPAAGRTGLVIAGGGSRSSFEIGALRYLYRTEGISPVAISGTSAGSILASVLAQHADNSSQTRAIEQLHELWSEMTESADMFTEQPWFTRLRQHIPTWRKVMALRQRQANRVSLTAGLQDLLSKPREAIERMTTPAQHSGARIAPGVPDPATTPPEHARQWTPAHALETLETLWEAGRSSADLDFILRGASAERAAFTPGPIVDKLLDPAIFRAERVATSPVSLRIAIVSLESGELRFVDDLGRLRTRDDEVIPGTPPIGVVEAVRASCAIPGVFPPVPLAGEHYVDGGVRENVPAAILLDHAELDHCYVVGASPPGVPPSSSFASKDLAEIVVRAATQITSDELQRDEIAYAHSRGAVVIQPLLDIHDMVTIEPGLIALAMDYGYLRAGDVCEGADDERVARTHEVIQLRRLIWSAEDELYGPDEPEDEEAAGPPPKPEEISDLKLKLRDLIADPGSAHLPPEADAWWRTWERHPFEIPAEPDWPGAR